MYTITARAARQLFLFSLQLVPSLFRNYFGILCRRLLQRAHVVDSILDVVSMTNSAAKGNAMSYELFSFLVKLNGFTLPQVRFDVAPTDEFFEFYSQVEGYEQLALRYVEENSILLS